MRKDVEAVVNSEVRAFLVLSRKQGPHGRPPVLKVCVAREQKLTP